MNIREEFKVHGMALVKTKKSSNKRKAFPVSTVKPDPQIWKMAKKIAKGDASRIFVKSTSECVVVNNEWQKRALEKKYSSSGQSQK